MARRYREVTYQEPVRLGFFAFIGQCVKWLVIICIMIVVLGAVL